MVGKECVGGSGGEVTNDPGGNGHRPAGARGATSAAGAAAATGVV